MNRMKTSIPPPRLFRFFFRRFCNPQLKNFIEGDLMELYNERIKTNGKSKTNFRFITEVLSLFRPGIILSSRHKVKTHQHSNPMIKNYFKIALRNPGKNRTYALINIMGLAMSMAFSFRDRAAQR